MNVFGIPHRTVWHAPADGPGVHIIDQRRLPFEFVVEGLSSVEEVAVAIRDMHVRGAGCIGATAAWGMFLAARQANGNLTELERLGRLLCATRPTAVNLSWAVERLLQHLRGTLPGDWIDAARQEAQALADEDAAFCRRIGEHGLEMLRRRAQERGRGGEPLNILTHCNAGWLAFVDFGSATAPIYAAHDAGLPVHVWVDETRPRNQGARLTAWELAQHGVPHTVIVDNAGGHLMQHGKVDVVITGADRVTRCGDVANKIGTYLKALAAADNGIPFYVALPSSTFDWSLCDGVTGIPIEERSAREVTHISGTTDTADGEQEFRLFPESSPAANPAFDVTPARLVTGLLTERGLCPASEADILALYPQQG
ncbi:MAG: S-methyl-5-thioribose-1-phosphate isomerase [Verrucomicrobiales bacterium]|nr:S-methyl-5-thioribose-1-phosphate isomerase [Verrucomicrobiales bacterium]